ncbi:MAG: hypothetical protein H6739_28700 [Alphaproteobacteria bacterium]|nr:hypothetical protein [Alphaproteobacteria bacterium]
MLPLLLAALLAAPARAEEPATALLIQQTLEANAPYLDACYERAPELATGHVDLRWTVRKGKARDVQVVADTLVIPAFSDCLVKRVDGLRFDAQVDGPVQWRFGLDRAEDPPSPTLGVYHSPHSDLRDPSHSVTKATTLVHPSGQAPLPPGQRASESQFGVEMGQNGANGGKQ